MNEISELAVKIGKVETEIHTHKDECGRRYQEGNAKQDLTLEYLQDITKQMNGLSEQIAEARGAGKAARLIAACVAGLMGFMGGLGGHIIIK